MNVLRHFLGAIDVPEIDDDGTRHDLFPTVQGRARETVPLRGDDESIRVLGTGKGFRRSAVMTNFALCRWSRRTVEVAPTLECWWISGIDGDDVYIIGVRRRNETSTASPLDTPPTCRQLGGARPPPAR